MSKSRLIVLVTPKFKNKLDGLFNLLPPGTPAIVNDALTRGATSVTVPIQLTARDRIALSTTQPLLMCNHGLLVAYVDKVDIIAQIPKVINFHNFPAASVKRYAELMPAYLYEKITLAASIGLSAVRLGKLTVFEKAWLQTNIAHMTRMGFVFSNEPTHPESALRSPERSYAGFGFDGYPRW